MYLRDVSDFSRSRSFHEAQSRFLLTSASSNLAKTAKIYINIMRAIISMLIGFFLSIKADFSNALLMHVHFFPCCSNAAIWILCRKKSNARSRLNYD